MSPHLIVLVDTLALIIQYFGVGILTISFVELIKEPFKAWFPTHHDKFLTLTAGFVGLLLQGLAFGWVSETLLEGFVVGVGVSGAYRVATSFKNPVHVKVAPVTLKESKKTTK